MFQDKQCRDCSKVFTPLSGKQVRCPVCKSLDRVICPECGGRHRPEPDTGDRCLACRTINSDQDKKPVVPSLTELPGRENTELCKFTLKLADKALKNAEGLDGYVSNLVSFAECASNGGVPSDNWQLVKLGHMVRVRK